MDCSKNIPNLPLLIFWMTKIQDLFLVHTLRNGDSVLVHN
jgi:hypothetical protein